MGPPTVGKIVFYYPARDVDSIEPTGPVAAIITRVNNNGSVDLHVFWPDRDPTNVHEVRAEILHTGRYWLRPPRAW